MFDDLRQLDPEFPHGSLLGADAPDLNGLRSLLGSDCRSGSGVPLRPVTQPESLSALDYERSVHDRGRLPVKPGWHDLFNICAWRLFPRAKAALNRGHVADPGAGMGRSRRRDALTLLDETGLLVASDDPELVALHRDHRWQELLVDRRDLWGSSIHVFVLGHGLLQQCLQPYHGLTAKALHVRVHNDFGELPRPAQRQRIDRQVARIIDQQLTDPSELLPLPVLGIPGWHEANVDPDYYRDASQFRPRRR